MLYAYFNSCHQNYLKVSLVAFFKEFTYYPVWLNPFSNAEHKTLTLFNHMLIELNYMFAEQIWTTHIKKSSLHYHCISQSGYILVLVSDLHSDNIKRDTFKYYYFMEIHEQYLALETFVLITHLIFLHKHCFIYMQGHSFIISVYINIAISLTEIIIFCLYLRKTLLIIRSLTGSSFILHCLSNFLFCKRCNSTLCKNCLFQ